MNSHSEAGPSRHRTYTLDENERIADGVVAAVASALFPDDPDAATTTALEPLYGTVDPDALEKVFRDDGRGATHVEFDYEGCRVAIEADGVIEVRPRE